MSACGARLRCGAAGGSVVGLGESHASGHSRVRDCARCFCWGFRIPGRQQSGAAAATSRLRPPPGIGREPAGARKRCDRGHRSRPACRRACRPRTAPPAPAAAATSLADGRAAHAAQRKRRPSLRRRRPPAAQHRRPPRAAAPRPAPAIRMRSASRARSRSTPPAVRASASSISGSMTSCEPGEVVLTFDDGPWPQRTMAVVNALAAHCTKAIFFPIGKHATYEPGILKQVAAAGHSIGSHTWSHQNLANKSVEEGKDEIEKGISAVALGGRRTDGAVLPLPGAAASAGAGQLSRRAQHRDLLDRHGLVRLQDAQARAGAPGGDGEAEEIRQRHCADARFPAGDRRGHRRSAQRPQGRRLQDRAHAARRTPITTIASYDEEVRKDAKLPTVSTRPTSSVVRTISE